MEIIPVIEIKAGKSIRKTAVRAEQPNLLTDDPLTIGKRWVGDGAKRLHVIDVDGARTGMPSPQHLVLIRDLIRRLNVPIQLDSAVHSRDVIERMLTAGVDRLVLGISVLTDPLAGEWFRQHGEKLIVDIRARSCRLTANGGSLTEATVQSFAQSLFQRGARRFLYRDIAPDGSTAPINIAGTKDAVLWTRVPVTAGSVITDIREITELNQAGVESVLLGQSLYEGKVSLADAIAVASAKPQAAPAAPRPAPGVGPSAPGLPQRTGVNQSTAPPPAPYRPVMPGQPPQRPGGPQPPQRPGFPPAPPQRPGGPMIPPKKP